MKKFISVFLVIALFATMLVTSGSAIPAQADEFNLSAKDYQKLVDQQPAVDANELLQTTFEKSAAGYVYPADFGGTFIENNVLYILLTQMSDTRISEYSKLLSAYKGSYAFKQAQYSYNELQTACDQYFMQLSKDYAVTSGYVDVSKNCIRIGMPAEDLAKASGYVNSQSKVFGLPVVLVQDDPAETQARLVGGIEITTGSYALTLGMCGEYNGADAFAISGHDMTYDANVKVSGITNGTITYIQWENNGYGDLAFVETNQYATLTNKVKASGSTERSITATVSNPPQGTYVFKYGEKTGYSSSGLIVAANSWITYDNYTPTMTINGLSRVTWGTMAGQHGDSGGPYYLLSNGQYAFCGIHSGANSDGLTTYFTPYYYLDFCGFTAKIN